MELKYIKPLIVSSIINMGLGAFLFIFGILEFTNIVPTDANTIYRTVGVQLSQLVFISGLLLFLSGALSFLYRKTMEFINLQIFIGVVSLAWPIFVSIALFFTTIPHTINIRLIPSILSALLYIICVLIVKIANEALRKSRRINTRMGQTGKRKRSANIRAIFSSTRSSKRQSKDIGALRGVAESFKTVNAASIGSKVLFSGGRRRSKFNPFKRIMNGSRRRSGGGFMKRLYSGSRHRRRRFRK